MLDLEDGDERAEDVEAPLTDGGDVGSEGAELLGAGLGAEAAGDLGLDLHHPQIPLREIVVEGDVGIGHEAQDLVLEVVQPIQQILGGTAFQASAVLLGQLLGGGGQIEEIGQAALSDELSISPTDMLLLEGGECAIALFAAMPSLSEQVGHGQGPALSRRFVNLGQFA